VYFKEIGCVGMMKFYNDSYQVEVP